MTRTIPELDVLIAEAKTTLYALYAERRQLHEVAKPPRKPTRKDRMDVAVAHFRSGMSKKDIAKTMNLNIGTVYFYFRRLARHSNNP